MDIILATGVPRVNEKIERKFAGDVNIVGKPLFREAVERTIEGHSPEVLLLSEVLEGTTPMDELILKVRARYPKTRIVYIAKNMDPFFKEFLYKHMIFDILNDKFTEAELKNAFFYPKEWTEVSGEIETLRTFQRPAELNTERPDISDMNRINKSEYARIKPIVTGKNSLYQEFIAFWSVLDQSGKTFAAINTALFLASNNDLKILLVDFNMKNPSVHLQFGFSDAEHNLGALVEDMDEENIEINSKTLDDYLISHPVYNNLKILPGYILRNKRKSPEEYISILNALFKAAQSSNYSTVLIDMESGINDELSIHILKTATKIILMANESPGSLSSIQKTFDPELGEFVPNLIDKKKVFPIINQATEPYYRKFRNALDTVIDENRTVTALRNDEKVHESIFEGTPLLTRPSDEHYTTFFKIADVIHNGLFKQANKKQNSGGKKPSLFSKKPNK